MHAIMGSVLQVPELRLEEDEAEKLGNAVQNVLAQYDVVVSPKAQAWIGAAMVAGAVYGPHVAAYGLRKGADRMEKKTGEPKRQAIPGRAPAKADNGVTNTGPVIDETDGQIFVSPFLPGGGLA